MIDKYSLSIGVIGVALFHLIVDFSFSQPPKKKNEPPAPASIKNSILKPKLGVSLLFEDEKIKPVLGNVFSGHVIHSHRIDSVAEKNAGCIGKDLYIYNWVERAKNNTDEAAKTYLLFPHDCISSIFVLGEKLYMKGRIGANYSTELLYEIASNGKLARSSKVEPVLKEVLVPPKGSYPANIARKLDQLGRSNPELLASVGAEVRLRDLPFRTFVSVDADKKVRVNSVIQLKKNNLILQDTYPLEPNAPIVPNIVKYENADLATRFEGKTFSELVVLDNGKRFIPIVDGDRNSKAQLVSYLTANKNTEDFAFAIDNTASNENETEVAKFSNRSPKFFLAIPEGIIGAETSIALSWDRPYLWFYDHKTRKVTKLTYANLTREVLGGISLHEKGIVVTQSDEQIIKFYGETNPFPGLEPENLEKE